MVYEKEDSKKSYFFKKLFKETRVFETGDFEKSSFMKDKFSKISFLARKQIQKRKIVGFFKIKDILNFRVLELT